MRLIFMGTPDFAVTILKAVCETEHEVVAVYTQPDRRSGRGKKMLAPDVKVFAESRGLPVFQPDNLHDAEAFQTFRELHADAAIVAAYGKILPPAWLEALPKGCINVHASLLPTYRGAAPIQWAVRNGDAESGISLMHMEEGMDTGGIYVQEPLALNPDEDSDALFKRMALLGGESIKKYLTPILTGDLLPVPQDEEKASYAPKFERQDEEINWSDTAENIVRLNLAFGKSVGTYSFLDGKRLKIKEMTVSAESDIGKAPGTVLKTSKDRILVQAGEGAVCLLTVQPAGKKAMPIHAYLNGAKVQVGDQFNRSDVKK